MKLIHIPFCFHPDPVGGTEVYVESLAREQRRQGVDVIIAAPGNANQQYTHNGLRVLRYAVTQQVGNLRDLYGEGDPVAAAAFGRILDQECPDLVHLHAFTRGASLRIVREAKRRGLPVVFSYHTPTVSCLRGTLLRWGSEICDGVLEVNACAQCALHGHGLNRIGSVLAGSLPSGVGRALGVFRASGGAWTAARMTELVTLRHNAFRSLVSEVDHIVALCRWVKELLVRNNVPEDKITLSYQGLDPIMQVPLARPAHCTGKRPLRIAFLGRLDTTKGAHILIEALKRRPALEVLLGVMGIAQGEAGRQYLRRLQSIADGDDRVKFCPPIPPFDVIERLSDYDLLAVPSQVLETGPRVVLEAFTAGIPVIGSNLGGIAELVRPGIDGLLLDPRSVEGWGEALEAICENRALLPTLRSGIQAPRNIRHVSDDMQFVYSRVLCSSTFERTSQMAM